VNEYPSLEKRKTAILLTQYRSQVTPLAIGEPSAVDKKYAPLDYMPEAVDSSASKNTVQSGTVKKGSGGAELNSRNSPNLEVSTQPSIGSKSMPDPASGRRHERRRITTSVHNHGPKSPLGAESSVSKASQQEIFQKKPYEPPNRDTLNQSLKKGGSNNAASATEGNAAMPSPDSIRGAGRYPVGPPGRGYYPPYGAVPYPKNNYPVPGGHR
jgi:hypothetical protein